MSEKEMRVYAPVDPIYRIPDMAINRELLENRAMTRFEQFESDRIEWLARREQYYLCWDDYISPIRKGPWEGSSNVHLPLTEIQCNALHARLMQAFFGLENWFYVDPQEEIDLERIQKIELAMKYILTRYANYNKGIYSAIDDWCWDLVTDGMGILSRDWKILQRRFIRVVENEEFKQQKLELQQLIEDEVNVKEFDDTARKLIKYPYKEEGVVRTLFNGPIITAEDPAYVLFKGDVVDCTDLNLHETVLKICYFTRDELISFKQSEFMDEDTIDMILEREPDQKGSSVGTIRQNRTEYVKDSITGVRTVHSMVKKDVYEFIQAYDRVALEVDDKKRRAHITDELVYFVHTGTRKLTRWTFLDRISGNGKRPLHMAHLYRRPRRAIGRGMVETQLPINETCDLLFNQAIDAGMLVNQPMFGYRGNSTFDPQEVRVEPGLGLKMDDPNNDLRFFSWNINPNWGAPLIGSLQSLSYQLTSLGPNAMGQVGENVGPTRSASGVRELLGETSVNLDVILKRAKAPYSEMMEGLYMDCLDRMPDKLMITVTGPEGEPEQNPDGSPRRLEVSRQELRKRVHFGLYANSQNLNKMAQEAAAMKIAQFLLQPVGLQNGIVKPENVYEIYMNVIRTMGVQRGYRFLSKPQNAQVALPLNVEIYMIMQGMAPPVILSDPDHQRKIDYMQDLANSDQAQMEAQYGIVNKDAMQLLQEAIQKHQTYLDVLNKPSNLQNPTGMQGSPTLGSPQGFLGGPGGAQGGHPQGGQQNPAGEGAQPEAVNANQ